MEEQPKTRREKNMEYNRQYRIDKKEEIRNREDNELFVLVVLKSVKDIWKSI